jgi:phosphatidylglycerol:prolipoprotein diacylglycerol transferase
MHQILFTVPGLGIKVYGFGLMLTIAMLAAMNLAAWRARREKLNGDQVFDLAIWVLIGGLLGARLFFVIEYWRSFESILDIFKIWNGGIVLYGSIIGGTITLMIYRRLRPFPLRPMLDAIAPALALGIAFGRIGCFLNGCCYGDLCQLPWAVTFPAKTAPWINHFDHQLITATAERSLAIHPTQIYSSIDGFLILALLSAYYPLRRRDGEVVGLFLIAYPITRFLIEQLRNDETGFVGGLTISQALSAVFFVVGLAYWAYLRTLPPVRYADTVTEVAPAVA